mmetsp:Transcript_17415/g.44595  ORF Transcript_17415/g.44595 Transcript_17415/m.44595 type:complete len:321 (+) Transcript_17415:1451-2413(+)
MLRYRPDAARLALAASFCCSSPRGCGYHCCGAARGQTDARLPLLRRPVLLGRAGAPRGCRTCALPHRPADSRPLRREAARAHAARDEQGGAGAGHARRAGGRRRRGGAPLGEVAAAAGVAVRREPAPPGARAQARALPAWQLSQRLRGQALLRGRRADEERRADQGGEHPPPACRPLAALARLPPLDQVGHRAATRLLLRRDRGRGRLRGRARLNLVGRRLPARRLCPSRRLHLLHRRRAAAAARGGAARVARHPHPGRPVGDRRVQLVRPPARPGRWLPGDARLYTRPLPLDRGAPCVAEIAQARGGRRGGGGLRLALS